jgi:tellurite resistance protein
MPQPGRFRRVPPMIFPPLLGGLLLGLGWREGASAFGLPGAAAEALLGATVALWVFAHAAYAVKLARRPGVLFADLAILPGQFGLGAAVTSNYAAVMATAPHAPLLARVILGGALLLHLVLMLAAVRGLRAAPDAARAVTPAWHLLFGGPLLGALAALAVGLPDLARGLALVTLPVAAVVGVVSLRQLIARVPPSPLRPLLLLHPMQAGVAGLAASGLGWHAAAFLAAVFALAMLIAAAAASRWLLVSGYTAFWGGAGLAPAAIALLFLRLPGLTLGGGVLLVVATLVALPVLVQVMRDWARGRLAAATNAAEA